MSAPTLAMEDRRPAGGGRVEAGGELEPRPAGAWSEELEFSVYADSSMTLPGKGDPGQNCGDWYPSEFCDECGEVHFGPSRCEQRTCPDCWTAWRRKRAEKMTRRLAAARHAADAGMEKRAVHATVSPPEGEIGTLAEVQQGFRDAYGLAKEKGVRGGVAIFHGFRVKDDAKALFEEEKAAGLWDEEEDGRLWAWVRQHERSWRSLTYWSPHYHILGLSAEFGENKPDEQDGWVVQRIRSLKAFKLHDIEGYEDMVGAAMYLLSHASFESDTSKDCVRWFGDLATAKFSVEEEVSEGALAVIERKAAEAAAVRGDRGDDADEEECDDCGATSLSSIFEAGAALCDPGWCERIGREKERRLAAAFEWVIGERKPPPGLKHPRSEQEAREAFAELV